MKREARRMERIPAKGQTIQTVLPVRPVPVDHQHRRRAGAVLGYVR